MKDQRVVSFFSLACISGAGRTGALALCAALSTILGCGGDQMAGFFEFDLDGTSHRVERPTEICGFSHLVDSRGGYESCALSQHSVESGDGARVCFPGRSSGRWENEDSIMVEVGNVHYATRGASAVISEIIVTEYGESGGRLVGSFSGVVANIDSTPAPDLVLENGRFDVPYVGGRSSNVCE